MTSLWCLLWQKWMKVMPVFALVGFIFLYCF